MQDKINRENWTEYFKGFSKRNQARSTKLEVFGEIGAQREERHLPLAGVSVEDSGKDAPRIEIMLGGGGVSQSQAGAAQVSGLDVTILVTAMPQNDRARALAAKLQPEEFVVTEEKKKQRILSVKRASEAPPIIAVLIQDDLVSHVNNEIQCVKDFIREAPEGSRVMTAYISTGSLEEAVFVPLVEHTITSTHQPYLEVLINDRPVGKVRLEVIVKIALQGAVLKIQGGKIKEIRSAAGQGEGEIRIEGAELVKTETKSFSLPGVIDLGAGEVIEA